jgi:hypothetical protein
MKDVKDMTRGEIERALEQAGKRVSKACDAFIKAGRGQERVQDILKQSDGLSVKYREASDRYREVNAECERRMTYHGSHQRVKA